VAFENVGFSKNYLKKQQPKINFLSKLYLHDLKKFKHKIYVTTHKNDIKHFKLELNIVVRNLCLQSILYIAMHYNSI
jgi:hypothetical protein